MPARPLKLLGFGILPSEILSSLLMQNSDKKQVRIFVSGRVQGVFFRAHSQEEAEKLELTGFARNLPDGRVEILLQGAEPKLLSFIEWAKGGAPKAEVDKIELRWEAAEKDFERFDIY